MNYRNWPIAKQIGTLAFVLTILVFGILSSISYLTASSTLKEKAITAMEQQIHGSMICWHCNTRACCPWPVAMPMYSGPCIQANSINRKTKLLESWG